MLVDLEDREESGWFDLRDGGRVQLRLLSGADLRAIRQKCVKTVPEYPLLDGQYRRFERQDFDADLFDEMRWDRAIIAWENIFAGSDKKPVDVTPQNKVALMRQVPEFAAAVEAGLKALKEAETARREAREKN